VFLFPGSTMTQEITPGIRMVTPAQPPGSAWESPHLYLVGDDPLTLIDSGYDREDDVNLVLAAIGSARLERIILTHGHIDHAGGAWAIRQATGAQVLAHPDDEPAIARRFPGKQIDGRLIEGDRVTAAGRDLAILHLPGHSPGHLALWDEASATIFPGDLVTGAGSTLVAPPEGNMAAYMKSLRRIQAMPIKLLLPGHGPIVTEPARRIAQLIEHRQLREICLLKCLADAPQPLHLTDLVQAMYLGLIHPQMIGPAAATALAHLQKLIAETHVIALPESETNPFHQTFFLAPGAKTEVLALY
jgi:glyoxylase-like metal-dependent hydrolase (beta-lactamase superfamily II)